jgi:hypothetical protein
MRGDRTAAPEPELAILLHSGPFHAALRSAVRERGLTLERLRVHLARRNVTVALSSLSDWQHGHRRPAGAESLRAVRALEEILGLRPAALTRLLIDTREGVPTYRPRAGLDERSGALADLLDRLPGARDHSVDIVSEHDKTVIGPDRRTRSIWTRSVLRARRDGVDRFVMRYFGDDGCAIDRVEPRAVENCTLGRVLRHPTGVLIAEVLFGQTLRAGDTWVVEEQIDDGTGRPSAECARGFHTPGQQYLMEVRFDPAALPVDCHTFAQTDLYDVRHRTGELSLSRHHTVHLLSCGVPGGILGIGWTWP